MTYATQLSAAFSPIAAVYDTPSLLRALSWAQSFVEMYCNQTFDLVTSDTVFITPARYRTALLPQVPVVNVNTVQALLPPQTSTGGGLTWQTLTNYRVVKETGLIYDTTGEPGVSSTLGLTWPTLPDSLQVSYDHGYSVIPQPLIDVSCRLAQQYLENPASLMQRRTGDTESRYSGSKGVPISEMDLVILGRFTDIGIA